MKFRSKEDGQMSYLFQHDDPNFGPNNNNDNHYV